MKTKSYWIYSPNVIIIKISPFLNRTRVRSNGFENDWDFFLALGIMGASFASTLNIARYSLMARFPFSGVSSGTCDA